MRFPNIFSNAANSSKEEATPATPAAATPDKDTKVEETPDVTSIDSFKDLWNNEPKAEGEKDESNNSPSLEVTPETLSKSLENVDFSKIIDSSLISKVAEGGEDAVQAMTQVMAATAKQTMMQSILIANKLADSKLEAAKAEYAQNLPSDIRQQTTAFHTSTEHPLLNNPALKPVVEATQQQLLQKYPNATPKEIADMSVNYFTAMGKMFGEGNNSSNNTAAPTEEDWSKFFEV